MGAGGKGARAGGALGVEDTGCLGPTAAPGTALGAKAKSSQSTPLCCRPPGKLAPHVAALLLPADCSLCPEEQNSFLHVL